MTRSVSNRNLDTAEEMSETGTSTLTPADVSADMATEAEPSAYTRRIEIRLALPTPPMRYEKGKAVRDPAPDPQKIIAAIRPLLERLNRAHHGAQTELVITAARAPGVRVDGTFGEKASTIQSRVHGWLDEAFEGLSDLSE